MLGNKSRVLRLELAWGQTWDSILKVEGTTILVVQSGHSCPTVQSMYHYIIILPIRRGNSWRGVIDLGEYNINIK